MVSVLVILENVPTIPTYATLSQMSASVSVQTGQRKCSAQGKTSCGTKLCVAAGVSTWALSAPLGCCSAGKPAGIFITRCSQSHG